MKNRVSKDDTKWKIRYEKRMNKKVRKIFLKQMNWVEKNMKKFFQENSIKYRKNDIENEIEVFLKKLPEKDSLAEEIVAFMRIALKRGGERIVRDLKMKSKYGISFDIKNENAKKFLKDKKSWELSNAQGNIDGTTKTRLKAVLVEALDSGQSYDKTAKIIRNLADEGVFSKARGEMIATREIGVAYEEGNAEVMDDFAKKFPDRERIKKWQTVNDSRVTPTHRANQSMGWIDYDETFDGTGDQHAPGSDNPRCRCFTKYQIPAKK